MLLFVLALLVDIVCMCPGGYNKLRNDSDSGDRLQSSSEDSDDSAKVRNEQQLGTMSASKKYQAVAHDEATFVTPKTGRFTRDQANVEGESSLTKRSQDLFAGPARFVRRALEKSYQPFTEEATINIELQECSPKQQSVEKTNTVSDSNDMLTCEASSEDEVSSDNMFSTVFSYQTLLDDGGKEITKENVGLNHLKNVIKQQRMWPSKLKQDADCGMSLVIHEMENKTAMEALLHDDDSKNNSVHNKSTIIDSKSNSLHDVKSGGEQCDDLKHFDKIEDVFALAPFRSTKIRPLKSSSKDTSETSLSLLSSPDAVDTVFANAPFTKVTANRKSSIKSSEVAATSRKSSDKFSEVCASEASSYMNPVAIAEQCDSSSLQLSNPGAFSPPETSHFFRADSHYALTAVPSKSATDCRPTPTVTSIENEYFVYGDTIHGPTTSAINLPTSSSISQLVNAWYNLPPSNSTVHSQSSCSNITASKELASSFHPPSDKRSSLFSHKLANFTEEEDPSLSETAKISNDSMYVGESNEPLLLASKSKSTNLTKKLRQSPHDFGSKSSIASSVSPFRGGSSPGNFIGKITGAGSNAGTRVLELSPTIGDDVSSENSSSSPHNSPYGSLKRSSKDKMTKRSAQPPVDSQFANPGFMDDLGYEKEENLASSSALTARMNNEALGSSYPIAATLQNSMNVSTKERSNTLPRSSKHSKLLS